MRKRTGAAAALAVAMAGLAGGLAGCGGSGSDDLSGLKIGVLVPLTGALDDFGGPGAEAARIAGAEVNRAAEDAGAELRVELIVEDTGTDAAGRPGGRHQAHRERRRPALAGPWAQQRGYPDGRERRRDLRDPAADPLRHRGRGHRDRGRRPGRSAPRPPTPSRAGPGPGLVADALGADATVNTAARNDSYGNGLIAAFTEAWEAGGGTVRRNVPYNPRGVEPRLRGRPDRPRQARRLGDRRLPGTWTTMGAALVRTGRWDPAKTFSADGLRSENLPNETSGAATEGMRGTAPTSIDAPAGDAFDELWRREADRPRSTYDANNFDAVVLLALAAAAAGSTDSVDIAGKLREVSGPPGEKYTFEALDSAIAAAENGEDIDYEGASGPIDLDRNGDPSASDYVVWVYRNGGLVDTDQIVSTGGGTAGGRALGRPRRRAAQVELGHPGVGQQRVAPALGPVLAALQHVAAVGQRQGAPGVLLDHHHGDAGAVDRVDGLEDLGHGHGREPGRRLVEHQHRRLGHQRARHGEHLALAARQGAGPLAAALAEPREALEQRGHPRPQLGPAQHAAHLQVLLDGQGGEDVGQLGHVAHPARGRPRGPAGR